MELKDLILCSHVTLSLFAINLSIRLTRSLVHLPCYPVFFTINLFTCPLVHLSTCHLPCFSVFLHKQLVHLSTRQLVHLLCYPVFFAINLFTRLLVYLSTYLFTLSFPQATCSLVYSFTRLLVHLSTYLVTLSFSQATCSLVYSFTCRNYSAIIDI